MLNRSWKRSSILHSLNDSFLVLKKVCSLNSRNSFWTILKEWRRFWIIIFIIVSGRHFVEIEVICTFVKQPCKKE